MRTIVLLALLCGVAFGQGLADKYEVEQREHRSELGVIKYCRKVIGCATATRPACVVLLFHGAGERGDNNESQLQWGAKEMIEYCESKGIDALLLAPQCLSGMMWVDTPWSLPEHSMPAESQMMKLAMEMLEAELSQPGIDKDRVYVTGLSMGGFATWDAISRYPEKFAAAMPVCGGVDVAQVAKFKDLPLLIYHGDSDTTVLTKRSRDAATALKAAGSTSFKYVEVPNCGHGSWGAAYGTPDNWAWLFSQKIK